MMSFWITGSISHPFCGRFGGCCGAVFGSEILPETVPNAVQDASGQQKRPRATQTPKFTTPTHHTLHVGPIFDQCWQRFVFWCAGSGERLKRLAWADRRLKRAPSERVCVRLGRRTRAGGSWLGCKHKRPRCAREILPDAAANARLCRLCLRGTASGSQPRRR